MPLMTALPLLPSRGETKRDRHLLNRLPTMRSTNRHRDHHMRQVTLARRLGMKICEAEAYLHRIRAFKIRKSRIQ